MCRGRELLSLPKSAVFQCDISVARCTAALALSYVPQVGFTIMEILIEAVAFVAGKESYSADDILAVAGPDDSIYNNSSAAFDMNSDSGSTGSSISVITDDGKLGIFTTLCSLLAIL